MSSEETLPDMEEPKPSNGKAKSLYVQLKPEVHEQLTLLAKVKGNPLTREIRDAIEAYVEASRTAPELANQAQAALDEIEQEARRPQGCHRQAARLVRGPAGDRHHPPGPQGHHRGGAGRQLTLRPRLGNGRDVRNP